MVDDKITKERINLLIDDIKKKKELSGISNEFVVKEVNDYLRKNPESLNKLIVSKKDSELRRSSLYKNTIKDIRKVLRKVYGAYQLNAEGRDELLRELSSYLQKQGTQGQEYIAIHKKILLTNLSTKERLEIYDSLYSDIFSITGNPESILDLGSGINPVSYPFLGVDKIKWIAYELSENDCKFLDEYFKIMARHTGLKGKAELTDLSFVKEFPKTDVCFLFKVLDVFEMKGHKLSEELLKRIKSKWIIASFSSRTISGKKMMFSRRGWFEMMLKRNEYSFKKIEKENEIFYVIKNK